jgi:NADP-dependent 3-hydroxy acid dehydrogenase YdfG
MAAGVASSSSAGSLDLGLQGSTVVVTGAGSGIGAAAARLPGAAGASVVLLGRREALLDQCAGTIEQAGGRAGAVIPLDGGQVIPHA